MGAEGTVAITTGDGERRGLPLASGEVVPRRARPPGLHAFEPVSLNCGLNDAPSVDCTGFGRISDQSFYQRPREYFFTVGLRY